MKKLLANTTYEMAAAILACIGDSVVSTDLDGNIVYMNRIAEELMGFMENEMIGRSFTEAFRFYHGVSKKTIENPLQEVLDRGVCKVLEQESVVITRGKVQRFLSATFSPIYNTESVILGAVAILKDVTRLKMLEKEQMIEKNNSKILFDLAPEPMLTLDESGFITQFNSAAAELLGKDRDQIIGRKLGESIGCIESARRREQGVTCGVGGKCENCEFKNAIRRSMEEQSGLKNREIRLHITRNGQEKICYFRISVAPIIVNGRKNTLLSLIDITENIDRENLIKEDRDMNTNILNQLPSLVWMTDSNLHCTYINHVFTSYTGIALSDMTDHTFIDLIHPDDLNHYVDQRKDAMHKQDSIRSEVRIRRQDGEYRWCLAVDMPYSDLNGRFIGYIGSFYDIEEQKRAEEYLTRYRKIINHARDLILLTDTDGWILEANKSAVSAYGYTEEELCGLNIRDIRPTWTCPVSDEEKEGYQGRLIETKHRKKDGTFFQVEVNAQTLRIGERFIVFNIARDITERKRAEKDIRAHREKYFYLFMNMKNLYAYYKILYGPDRMPYDMQLVEVNKACELFFGKTKEELIGKKFSELFPNSKELFMKTMRRYSGKLILGESINLEDCYMPDYDKWLSISVYSPYEEDVVAISNDITEKKQFELKLISTKEAAEAASRAKSEFLANMSHEIRTPINGMVGMVDLTLLTKLDEEQRDNLISAKVCANSLLKIINDILDFSKMEAGKLSIETISFDIRQLIEEIVRTYAPRVAEKNLELMYAMDSKTPQYLVGDPNRIRQVIHNFLSNAVKFTESGSILLSVKCEEKKNETVRLHFSVKDTGIGIAQEDIKKLFTSFQQVEQTFTKKYGGTGLGLAISKNLIELMGGKIGVKSAPGSGSEFFFSLLLGLGQPVVHPEDVRVDKKNRHYKVLVAEDDKLNQIVVMKMLQEMGHEAVLAQNGQEVLRLWEKGQFDVILMDIQMPEMNGLTATKNIRQKENEGERTPIVALTAYTLKGDRERFLMSGMDEYLPKPFGMEEMSDTIVRVVEKTASWNQSVKTMEELSKNKELLLTEVTKQGLRKRTPIMMQEIKENIELMETAIQNDKLLVLEEAAHAVKLQAIEIEEIRMKDVAFAIELSVRRGNWEEAVLQVYKIKDIFHSIQWDRRRGKRA